MPSNPPPLPRVYAYRDEGPMASNLTRWKPRQVFCTRQPDHGDKPGERYVVKYRQGRPGTCALISEVVCGCLLRSAGIPSVECSLVHVSQSLAARYRSMSEMLYRVEPEWHFGSLFHDRGTPGELRALALTDLSAPQETVDLWVFDTWVCNIDRTVHGNIIRVPAGEKIGLVAVDQSECFSGSGCLADGSWVRNLGSRGCAETANWIDSAIYSCGGSHAIRSALSRIDAAVPNLAYAVGQVPPEWWPEAGLNQQAVEQGLRQRAGSLSRIIDLPKWEGMDHATGGGQVLGGT